MHRGEGHTHGTGSSAASEGGGEEGHKQERKGRGRGRVGGVAETAQRVEVQDEGASGYIPMQAYPCKTTYSVHVDYSSNNRLQTLQQIARYLLGMTWPIS